MGRGEVYEYLGMTPDFSVSGKVKVIMGDCVKKTIKNFPLKLKSTDMEITPSGNNIFENVNGKTWG